MIKYYLNESGKKKFAQVESYFAKRSKINEIIQFASGCDERGRKRSIMIYKPKFENIDPVKMFEEQTETELECYPLVVVWTEEGFFSSGSDEGAFYKFHDYII